VFNTYKKMEQLDLSKDGARRNIYIYYGSISYSERFSLADTRNISNEGKNNLVGLDYFSKLLEVCGLILRRGIQ